MTALNRRHLLAGAIALASGPALAQQAARGPVGPGMGGGSGLGRTSDPDGYMDSLKTQLGITPAQEPAWKTYASTAIGMSTQMQGVGQNMRDSMPTATAQQRRDTMDTMSGARQMAHNSVHEAALKLLPVLTPEQRQKAASILPGLVTPGPMGQGRGRGPGMGSGSVRSQPPPG